MISKIEIGKGRIVKEGHDLAVLSIGTRLEAVLSGTVNVGNVADEIDDAPVAKPKVDTKPVATKVETPVVEEDDTLAYFEKLAE